MGLEERAGPCDEAGLSDAADVDAVAAAALRLLTGPAEPGAVRAGFALAEGGGRRLLFCPSDALAPAADGTPGTPAWCHIDAYDDVPLTRAVRTGRTVAGLLHELALGADFVERQQERGVAAIVAAALEPAHRLGGLVLFLDRAPTGGDVAAVEALALEAGRAVRRLRAAGVPEPHPADCADPADPAAPEAPEAAAAPAPSGAAGSPPTAQVRLAPEATSPGAARRFVRRRLTEWGVDDDVVDAALLCTSELVTNAVVHAVATVDVELALEPGRVVLAVRDHGALPVDAAALVAAVGGVGDDLDPLDALVVAGRGLGLVAALADDWGAEAASPGLRAWCALAR